ncbi:YtxH domain-containing protein [Paenibacillus flagellatus]|uniref:YtxH domain-containing protein n=1 Tax=Paenibacillus flagellatus TaxID=2211139 RepID=A0A2V5K9E9_9BACL|nr:YtxH domain-containing protein [Paenibacillus flagellatus]PYI56145.1 YtxH domain-containing protein [Paenibacillus flagellatus]
MSEHNGRGKDFLLGAIVGGVLGAVTALLLAPKSGKELRKDLSEQAHRVSEKTLELAETVGTKTHEIAETVGAKTQVIAKQVSEQTGEWVQKAKEVVETVSDEVRAWKDARREVAATGEEMMPADADVLVRRPLK